jgi:2-dehydro-3-deoxyphosphogluconate aldolase/(4S)-4-hydroxy-2-oxoglutarate aldolase
MKMTKKEEQLRFLIDCGVVAVMRADSSDQLIQVADAIKEGGVKVIEVTMTTPGALGVIEEASKRYPAKDVLIGAGTVLDPETARACILAGAEFIVSPTLNLSVISLCNRYAKCVIPGAFTPTEILTAWENGADIIKVFPATALGPQYFKDIHGPLPQIPLLPTGGVSLENAGDFIKAGAVAIAVGTALVDRKIVAEQKWELLTERAAKIIEAVKKARA